MKKAAEISAINITYGGLDDARHTRRLGRSCHAFPQTFVLEKYRPHRPLKVGIASDLSARCPEVERRVLGAALAYTRRIIICEELSRARPVSISTAIQPAR